MKNKIAIIGGDLKSVNLAEMLMQEGHEVITYGLENAEGLNNNVVKCKNLGEAIDKSNIIIGPIPLSSNGIEINMLFSNEKIKVEDFFSAISSGKVVIAGNIKDNHYKIIEEKNAIGIDILKREELSVLNAISTAEGTISIAVQETTRNLHGSNILVMGFGKVGKVLAKMLDGIGANVYCEARKNVDLAWIKAYGYNPINLNDIDQYLEKFDIIINTIPFVVLDEEKLDKIKKNCVIIDIAGNPGGIDRIAAKKKKIKFTWALSLASKVAPETTAEFLKETIDNIIKEL